MAIDTTNERYAAITYQQLWNTPIPIPSGTVTDGDKQQLLAEYPGIIWELVPQYLLAMEI